MEKETRSGIRVATEWAAGLGAVIALVAGIGILAKLAIVVLVLAGGIGFTLAAYEHGWLPIRVPWKPLLVIFGIWGGMLVIGWKAWPREMEAPSITWAIPQEIDTETPISSKQLNASSLTPGDFIYTPSLGSKLPTGSNSLTVTFVPKDSEKFRSIVKTVFIHVVTATPAPLSKRVNTKADLIADFISPRDLLLVISNSSTVTADRPTFQTYLVNLDSPTIQVLPIGRQTGDFLKGRSSLLRIPILHYGNSVALDGIKNGDRVFGWISLSCSNCEKVRYYYVYYEYQREGWYSASRAEPEFDLDRIMKLAAAPNLIDDWVHIQNRVPLEERRGIVRFPEQGTGR